MSFFLSELYTPNAKLFLEVSYRNPSPASPSCLCGLFATAGAEFVLDNVDKD